MKDRRIVWFDVETSGLDVRRHEIIQIAAVATDCNLTTIGSMLEYCWFDETEADPDALKTNNYDPEVWEERAIAWQTMVHRFQEFCQEHATVELVSKITGKKFRVAKLAGHNVIKFDIPFIERYFGRMWKPYDRFKPLDTYHLANWVTIIAGVKFPDLKLVTLYRELIGDDIAMAHDAREDVHATIAVYAKLKAILTDPEEAQAFRNRQLVRAEAGKGAENG